MSPDKPQQRPRNFWTTLPGILTGLAGLITAVGGLITVLYSTGVIGSQSRPRPADAGIPGSHLEARHTRAPTSWIVRLSNVDDHGYAFLNGSRILECHAKGEPLCEREITELLREGPNTLRIEFLNDVWGWTYQYQILRDGEVWAEDKCGRAGHQGCRNEDKTTGTVFEKEFEIRP